jgi:hypothetical protein
MIEFVFTIDYEIYGNGKGSLRELVLKPAERLKSIFEERGAPFVLFAEVAELEVIEAEGIDTAIDLVKGQLRDFHRQGTELGLHLHPQWYNARYKNGEWMLDYNEYSLCTLQKERIVQIIDRSIEYLRKLLQAADFMPISFRAGNWLFQPAKNLSKVLAEQGIKVDSSVFKGGRQHQHKLDYRRALNNGYFWRFADNVSVRNPSGSLLELPIYTRMVPIWQMLTAKRIQFERKGPARSQTGKISLFRLLDFLRFCYPIKFDFCRMTINELIHMLDAEIRKDSEDPATFRPIVAIGHTKDLMDYETIGFLLDYMRSKGVKISGFREVYRKIQLLDENENNTK